MIYSGEVEKFTTSPSGLFYLMRRQGKMNKSFRKRELSDIRLIRMLFSNVLESISHVIALLVDNFVCLKPSRSFKMRRF